MNPKKRQKKSTIAGRRKARRHEKKVLQHHFPCTVGGEQRSAQVSFRSKRNRNSKRPRETREIDRAQEEAQMQRG